jgi:hypothetical protein
MSLKSTIDHLAAEFATGVIDAIRASNLQEILAETGSVPAKRGPGRPGKVQEAMPAVAKGRKSKGGRLARRSEGDIQHVIASIEAALRDAKDGLRSEDLRAKLGLSRAEIMRPIQAALAAKRIKKTGEKRATTYFAAK